MASILGRPPATKAPAPSAKAEKHGQPSRAHGALGARFAKQATDTLKSIPAWLFVFFGVAIALLAVASVPLRVIPNRRAATTLANHRGSVAFVGAALLGAVSVAYVLS